MKSEVERGEREGRGREEGFFSWVVSSEEIGRGFDGN